MSTGGNYILLVKDLAGNTTGATFSIDNIPPTYSGIINGGYYNTGVTITFADSNLSGAILSGLEGNTYFSGDFGYGSYITGDGKYKLIVSDLLGNLATAIFVIDTVPPTTNIIDGQTYTQAVNITFADNYPGVTATLDGVAISYGINLNTNGLHQLLVKDLAGNETQVIFTINISTAVSSGSHTPHRLEPDNCLLPESNLEGANLSGIDYSESYYDKKCISPRRNIEIRMSAAISYNNITSVVQGNVGYCEVNFIDIQRHPYGKYIDLLAKLCLVNGRAYDRFYPNKDISNSEILKIIVGSLLLKKPNLIYNNNSGIKELPEHWAHNYIKNAQKIGYVFTDDFILSIDQFISQKDFVKMFLYGYSKLGKKINLTPSLVQKIENLSGNVARGLASKIVARYMLGAK